MKHTRAWYMYVFPIRSIWGGVSPLSGYALVVTDPLACSPVRNQYLTSHTHASGFLDIAQDFLFGAKFPLAGDARPGSRVETLVITDPAHRPHADQALKHAWLNQNKASHSRF